MKKNIFSVFQSNDTDDEGRDKVKSEPVKMNKKDARAADQVKREHFGDKVEKEVPVHQKFHDAPRNKGDYKPGEKRPYERHSGTGRPAFTHDFKKGGHGHGNVGGQKDIEGELSKEKKEGETQEGEATPAKTPEPVEEIITLDEYVSKAGFNTDFLKQQEEAKAVAPLKLNDTTVKVVAPRAKEETQYTKKNMKHVEEHVHSKGTNVQLDGGSAANGYRVRGNNREAVKPKGPRVEFNEANFPALN